MNIYYVYGKIDKFNINVFSFEEAYDLTDNFLYFFENMYLSRANTNISIYKISKKKRDRYSLFRSAFKIYDSYEI